VRIHVRCRMKDMKFGLKDDTELSVVSPSRRQPKKVTNATAQMAAWKWSEGVMALRNAKRCSIETGARRGRLCHEPSLFAEIRAICTHLSSPYQGA
jgi:hypothetical protein